MMETVRHVPSSSGLRKFQAAWFLLNRGYKKTLWVWSPLRLPNFTLAVERNYCNVTAYNTFHNSSLI